MESAPTRTRNVAGARDKSVPVPYFVGVNGHGQGERRRACVASGARSISGQQSPNFGGRWRLPRNSGPKNRRSRSTGIRRGVVSDRTGAGRTLPTLSVGSLRVGDRAS